MAGGLLAAPAAQASEQTAARIAQVSSTSSGLLQEISSSLVSEAIAEAAAGGYGEEQETAADGSVTSTLNLGQGLVVDIASLVLVGTGSALASDGRWTGALALGVALFVGIAYKGSAIRRHQRHR